MTNECNYDVTSLFVKDNKNFKKSKFEQKKSELLKNNYISIVEDTNGEHYFERTTSRAIYSSQQFKMSALGFADPYEANRAKTENSDCGVFAEWVDARTHKEQDFCANMKITKKEFVNLDNGGKEIFSGEYALFELILTNVGTQVRLDEHNAGLMDFNGDYLGFCKIQDKPIFIETASVAIGINQDAFHLDEYEMTDFAFNTGADGCFYISEYAKRPVSALAKKQNSNDRTVGYILKGDIDCSQIDEWIDYVGAWLGVELKENQLANIKTNKAKEKDDNYER